MEVILDEKYARVTFHMRITKCHNHRDITAAELLHHISRGRCPEYDDGEEIEGSDAEDSLSKASTWSS